jgi:5S rRNA maturation endonuclease (ribonuclease M5)
LPDGRTATHRRLDNPDGSKQVWWEVDGKKGLDGMSTASLPLYGADRLEDIIRTEDVVICEGEKAADALLEHGVIAVGTVTGANGTPSDESLKALLGRTVYLWADNDEPGYGHMSRIAKQLFKLGTIDVRTVRWVEAPPKGDAADFAGDNAEIQKLLEASTREEKDEIDLPALLTDIQKMITKYVVLTPHQADAVALWVAHTWTFEATETTPYLSITSPEKRSGKTRLLETLERLVRKPWFTGRTSAAALYRKVDKELPTLLLDEIDATLKGDKELSETLRGILNTGHREGGAVTITVGQGSHFDVRDFSTFCPKAIAGIGSLPDTVADRSIPIELKRKAKPEPVARFRHRSVGEEATPIRGRLEAWASNNIAAVAQSIEAEPELPDTLSDRAADGWEPLKAIADLAGGDWPERAVQAAMTISAGEEDGGSIGVRLLGDIATVFRGRDDQRNISTADLLHDLSEMVEAPWGDWFGRPITTRQLSKWLKQYGVHSRSIRIGNKTPKGYRRQDFVDAWSRYTPYLSATAQHPRFELESAEDDSPGTSNVADTNSVETAHIELNVADVAEKVGATGERTDYAPYMPFVGDHDLDNDELLI